MTFLYKKILKKRVCSTYFDFELEARLVPPVYEEEGDDPLKGIITLESWGLGLTSFTRTLHPMRMLMAKLEN